MKELIDGLLTKRHTKVEAEENFTNNTPHHYKILKREDNQVICDIHFQDGPVEEAGVNGIFMEDLLAICANNLRHFQASNYACRENAIALTKIEEAMMWLGKRTKDREARGVLGTKKL